MKLLDLFCGAGGAAKGYADAGFEVVGVDINPQPNYPFEFIQMDAIHYACAYDTDGFDAIHASPPCQGYTPMSNRYGSRAAKLIKATREALWACGLPYVIENVPGAPLKNPSRLCGSFFGLGYMGKPLYRHRLFETSFPLFSTPCLHTTAGIAVYGKADGRRLYTRADGSELRAWASLEEGQVALGVEWMQTVDEVREAIPPAFTKYVGEQLLEQLEKAA